MLLSVMLLTIKLYILRYDEIVNNISIFAFEQVSWVLFIFIKHCQLLLLQFKLENTLFLIIRGHILWGTMLQDLYKTAQRCVHSKIIWNRGKACYTWYNVRSHFLVTLKNSQWSILCRAYFLEVWFILLLAVNKNIYTNFKFKEYFFRNSLLHTNPLPYLNLHRLFFTLWSIVTSKVKVGGDCNLSI